MARHTPQLPFVFGQPVQPRVLGTHHAHKGPRVKGSLVDIGSVASPTSAQKRHCRSPVLENSRVQFKPIE